MAGRVACLVNGKVLVLRGEGEPLEVESPYAEQIVARERSIKRRNDWKTKGRGAMFMSGGGGGAAGPRWGDGARDLPPARVVGLSRGRLDDEICYSITSGVVSGLFAQEPGTRDEQRLHHNAEAQVIRVGIGQRPQAANRRTFATLGFEAVPVVPVRIEAGDVDLYAEIVLTPRLRVSAGDCVAHLLVMCQRPAQRRRRIPTADPCPDDSPIDVRVAAGDAGSKTLIRDLPEGDGPATAEPRRAQHTPLRTRTGP